MSKVGNLPTVAPTLDELRRELIAHYEAGVAAVQICIDKRNEAKVRAFMVGRCALLARRQMPSNQEFGVWIESCKVVDNRGCQRPISRQTVYRWMALAEAHEKDISLLTTTVVSATPDPRMLAMLATEIEAKTSGKSLRQLELDLGLRTAPVRRPFFCFVCKAKIASRLQPCPHCGHHPQVTQEEESAAASRNWLALLERELHDLAHYTRKMDDASASRLVMLLAESVLIMGALSNKGEIVLDGETVTPVMVRAWRAKLEADL